MEKILPKFLLRFCIKSLLFIIILPYLITLMSNGISADASIRYDQSQLGDYNVQIHLKNIELYAILDDGIINSDYDYDYADLTEKPTTGSNNSNSYHHQWWVYPNGTSLKPPLSSAVNAANISNNSNLNNNNNYSNSHYTNNNYNYNGNPSTTAETFVTGVSTPQQPNKIYQPPLNITTSYVSPTFTTAAGSDSTFRITRKCAPGYYRDTLGRCRRIRKPHLPFLQMVHTPGVIKSFQQSVGLDSSKAFAQSAGSDTNSSTGKSTNKQ